MKKKITFTFETAKEGVEELISQGHDNEEILGFLYDLFCEDSIDIQILEELVKLIGYELTEEFKSMSLEDQKTKGYEYYEEQDQPKLEEKEKTVKEIVIKTSHIFMVLREKEDVYKDEMIITENSISYQRFNIFDEKYNLSWSHKTTSKEYKEKFNKLCSSLYPLKRDSYEFWTDCGEFEFVIKYNDLSEEVYSFTRHMIENENLKYLAYLIRDIAPISEPISGMIDYKIEKEYLDIILDDYIDKLSDSNVVNNLTWNYPEWVWEIFDLIPLDYKYSETTDKLLERNVDIRLYDFNEVKAMLTYVVRNEHFCDGAILEHIKNGTVLKLLKRLKELVS